MAEPKGDIFPIYFVADESQSMEEYIDELNDGLKSLLDEIHQQPTAGRKVRFSIIGFGTDAILRLPITDLIENPSIPTLAIHGSTSYVAAFEEIYNRIKADVADLQAQEYKVNRPAVFFLTDGCPYPENQPWKSVYDKLVDTQFACHPNILAFGIGDVEEETILEVATKPEYAFIAEPGADVGKALSRFIEALTKTIIKIMQGSGELPVVKPEGFLQLATEMTQ